MKTPNSKLIAAGVTGLVVLLLFVFAYLLPRIDANRKLAEEITALEESTGQLSGLLGEAGRYRRLAPNPEPDVPGWVAANALAGIERKLISNDPYRKGLGAQVKLRNLPPEQVVAFLGQLVRVNVIVKRLVLQDWDANGSWDLEVFIEVPEGSDLQ